eukprot:TRINITY_DN638_c0_g2_i1.p1 TRINITY_DN638_c0_g2~~TRINITY_DN638_c0_g2_i1.p1  ORF type:complete len:1561 (+),score=284.72 TRINITY_DN638_c0_g2_i1:71-4753(+)
MWELLEWMLKLFVFIMKLTLDIICLMMGVIAFCSGIRTIPLIGNLMKCDNRNDFRIACFVQFMVIFMDIPCILMFFASLAVPWRIIPVIKAMAEASNASGNEYFIFELRYMAFAQFFLSLYDIPAFLSGLISLMAPWRTVQCVTSYWEIHKKHQNGKYYYDGDLRNEAMVQSLLIFVDIPCIMCGMFAMILPWRFIPTIESLWKCNKKNKETEHRWNSDLRILMVSQGILSMGDFFVSIMFVFTLISGIRTYQLITALKEKWSKEYEQELCYYGQRRGVVVVEFGYLLLDIVTLPITIILLLSWRAKSAIDIMRGDEKAFDKKIALVGQLFELVVDIPFVILFLFVVATLWRLVSLVRRLSESTSAKQRRKACWQEFVGFWKNSIFFIPFLLIVASVYRLIISITRFIELSKQPIFSADKKIRIKSYRAEILAQGGIKIFLSGEKPRGFTFRSAKLYIIGDTLWSLLTPYYNSTVLFVAKNMLPIELVPDSINMTDISADSESFDTDLHFGIGNAQASVKNLTKLLERLKSGGPTFRIHIHVEYGNQEGVLFDLYLDPASVLESLKSPQMIPVSDERATQPPPTTTVMSYDEIFVSVVIEQALLLGRDLICIFGILRLLLLSPWNLVPMTIKMLENDEHALKREAKEHLAYIKQTGGYLKNKEKIKQDLFETSLSKCKSPSEFESALAYIKDPNDPHAEETEENISKTIQKLQALKETSTENLVASFVDTAKNLDSVRNRLYTFYYQEQFKPIPMLSEAKQYAGTTLESELASLTKNWEDALEAILKHQVQVPSFWRGASWSNRSWSDKCTVVFGVLKKSTMDALAGFCALLITITLVRLIPLLKSVKRSGTKWHTACFRQLKELCLDLCYIVMFGVVVALVRHSVALVLECLSALYVEKDVQAARKCIEERFSRTWEDIFYLLSFVTMFKTYQYIVAISIWGTLGPADSIAQMLRDLDVGSFIRKTLSVFIWLFLVIFPFVITYRISSNEDNDELQKSIAFYLGVLLFISLVSFLYSMRKGSKLEKTQNSIEVHGNVQNFVAIFQILLEIYQNIGFVLETNAQESNAADWYSSVSFLGFDAKDGWQIPFWIVFFLCLVWFFLSSAPLVVEELLSWRDTGYFSGNPLWNMLMYNLSTTFMLTIIVNLMKVLDCTSINGHLYLEEYPDIQCYSNDSGHKSIALLALLSLAYYLTTACLIGIRYNVERASDSEWQNKIDIVFTVFYTTALILYKLLASAIRVFSATTGQARQLYLALNVAMLAFSIGYPSFAKGDMTPILTLGGIRTGGYAMAGFVAILSLILDPSSESNAFWTILIAGCFGLFVAFAIWGFARSQRRDKKLGVSAVSRADMKKVLAGFRQLAETTPLNMMLHRWESSKSKWIRKLNTFQKPPHPHCQRCNRFEGLAEHLIEFQENVKWHSMTPTFIAATGIWTKSTKNARSLQQISQALVMLSNGISNSSPIQAPVFNETAPQAPLYQPDFETEPHSHANVESPLGYADMTMEEIIQSLSRNPSIPSSLVNTILDYNLTKQDLLGMSIDGFTGIFGPDGRVLYDALRGNPS